MAGATQPMRFELWFGLAAQRMSCVWMRDGVWKKAGLVVALFAAEQIALARM